MKVGLTIAGSDTSGGAGIQADLKTMTLNGVYAESVITSLTAQNTTGVIGIFDLSPDFLAKELDAVFTDIYPDAVKIGMVSSKDLIETISERLIHYKAKNIVLDPVMVATSGAKLLRDEAIEALLTRLFPLASLITPNIPEAQMLIGKEIKSPGQVEEATKKLYQKYQTPILLKGGHAINDANDYLYDGTNALWLRGERIENTNTHGTGCTLSSAIAANLAKGYDLEKAIRKAKTYLEACLKDGLNLGKGSGPLNHAFALCDYYKN
ncbi:bifunctional hydroxymethylpyrimidine kinase/phosphomethylpyrimidine kinase [uncultured Anaerococcus sp.]|uniref:bifunctional hydroxymethylpyrimidine kinase/phosphomethylpyrimidine kinase n=1 Tax=uncultured Anaerococcus sp. TaxID=293428 RepID=UPI00288B1E3F|nr:bifunctional hydroxymethylpyrimidine kinase/phosphomethylpyrimidine kinase [uncultured Anaerococcus sp.]